MEVFANQLHEGGYVVLVWKSSGVDEMRMDGGDGTIRLTYLLDEPCHKA